MNPTDDEYDTASIVASVLVMHDITLSKGNVIKSIYMDLLRACFGFKDMRGEVLKQGLTIFFLFLLMFGAFETSNH